MVAFLTPTDEFRVWMDHVAYIVRQHFEEIGVEPLDLNQLPDQKYRDWYDDGIEPFAVADTVFEEFMGRR